MRIRTLTVRLLSCTVSPLAVNPKYSRQVLCSAKYRSPGFQRPVVHVSRRSDAGPSAIGRENAPAEGRVSKVQNLPALQFFAFNLV